MPRTTDGAPPPGLFDADPFAGFGPSRFRPPDLPTVGRRVRSRGEAQLRQKVRADAPKRPGVYGMLDGRGRVIYIGKAKSLRARLLSYFRKESRDPKAGRILSHTKTLVWEEAPDEFGALLRELELIRRFRPRFNVVGQPGPRRWVYLCLGKAPAPFAYLSREPAAKAVGCYGPLVGRGRADDAVRRLNDYFRLRDCPSRQTPVFADQSELFAAETGAKCLRYEIGTCLGPCGGGCTRREYATAVRSARLFLDGKTRAPLDDLTARMTAAAAGLQFEQAMAARDRLQSLTWLADRLNFLRGARRANSFVYPLAVNDGRPVWYLIHHGEVQAAVREPWEPAEKLAAAALIGRLFGAGTPAGTIDSKCVDSVLLVTGWFKRYPDEKPRLLSRDAAVAKCAG